MITVSNGFFHSVTPGQPEIGDIVMSGGTLDVLSGATVSNTTDSGLVIVSAGGSAFGTMIGSGGFQLDFGMASGTIANNGGVEDVFAGGMAINTTLIFGGNQVVASGGVASGTTIFAGGIAKFCHPHARAGEMGFQDQPLAARDLFGKTDVIIIE